MITTTAMHAPKVKTHFPRYDATWISISLFKHQWPNNNRSAQCFLHTVFLCCNGNGNSNSINNNDNNIITTDVASLIPPFETIGFFEGKWLEVLKELVEYGNKNILRNFTLYLVMAERRVEEEYAKEVTRDIRY